MKPPSADVFRGLVHFLADVCHRLDCVLRELDVAFAGFGTEVPEKMTEQTPAVVKCFFEYVGSGSDYGVILKRVYHLVWGGMIMRFPDLVDWAGAKADMSNLTLAQAEVLRARRNE